jgi:hypothetical protein
MQAYHVGMPEFLSLVFHPLLEEGIKAMVTRHISREEWVDFFDDLSDQDEGITVTLETLDTLLGDQIIARDLPLQGITLVEKGSDAGEIEILLGESTADHFSHVVTQPSRVTILETPEGDPQTLQIEAEGHTTVLMHFQRLDEDLVEEEEEVDLE